MKKGQSENKILVVGVIVTFLIIAALFIKKNNTLPGETQPPTRTETTGEINQQINTETETPLEEGLYLEIISPVSGTTTSDPSAIVAGKTQAAAEVFINEAELKADLDGNFSTTVNLEEGENNIVVTASDDEGNYSEKTITVTYELAE